MVRLLVSGMLMMLLMLNLQHPQVKCDEEEADFKHTNIILIGATGNLAEKYLWRSLFELFSKYYVRGKQAFSIYGCSRNSPNSGREFMSDILLKVIKCPLEDEDCKSIKKKFVEAIQYHQLKTEAHYKALGEKVNENIQGMYGLQGSPRSPEDGRLVYLSIPPSAYAKTSMMVNKYLRPIVGRPWFRVVIEKPFGHSLESAKSLTDKLKDYFREQELYRIDHYLGKTIVKEILPFRYFNRDQYEQLWNRQFVDRVEVVMKEKLDVKGRTKFYDEVGILRDVMQNHLTEMAVLIGMELPKDSGIIRDIVASKINFLNQVEPLADQGVVTGQYATYYNECASELAYVDEVLNTPTYAAAVLSINNARWRGVPFVLMSGKKLDEKLSYVRIVFKDNKFLIKGSKSKGVPPSQIVFHISSGNLNTPDMITVSKTLPKPKSREQWDLQETESQRYMFGESINNTYQLVPEETAAAYTVLLEAVLQGYRHMFVDSQSLRTSWKIWNNIVKSTEKRRPRLYQGARVDPERLDFHILGTRGLAYVQKEVEIKIPDVEVPGMGLPEIRQIPASFRGGRLVTDTREALVVKLVEDIMSAATEAIRERGAFHLALPGGQSPVLLFSHMAAHPTSLPWENIHIWQVDERCVTQDHVQSNFHLVNSHLLPHVPVPYLNIHPMPVDLSCEPCSQSDNGDDMYASKLNKILINATLDYVLLGVGFDGHIASLFPNQSSLEVTEKSVIYSEAGPEKVSPKRMTLTFPVINRSRNIAVIILGPKKHELIQKISSADGATVNQYPVLGIKPLDGSTLSWFIDNDALFGDVL